ncbi:MAG: membrane protein insertase YidC [Roseofilum sp. SBFL]|uniref:membrane protein insertase YidC n=1 Tax=unclassified Roseofilum TaxID=2620099 RepID=UPI001B083D8E|nr:MULTISPECIES: membrane protein insertase YidC [unclassified Roseofilum]MBP0015758.1 membrane protein insertase YidC [Roseofilum sp. SID3]MBP0025585.1 membrane protein insertase YidC [Roseofilum sp. SID2]MBP0037684.1 membrane protein insertase YidC [Roseofilum sp. SID1]MBP0040992.1 membrane protein insertase YidC [Roseofilum sp. SBFL]
MDFGIGFLSSNVMLPILDFFYGIVPSYGLAIVALTLVIRFALYPLSAGSIRSMRRTRVVQPYMQKRQEEIRNRYKDDPTKQQEEMAKLFKEVGNPLAGCLPVLIQMPVLFALFATLRGSPFADVNYTVDVQIFPQEQIQRIQPQIYATKPQNIYIEDGVHAKVAAILPGGNKIGVGEKTQINLQTVEGQTVNELVAQYPDQVQKLQPTWTITKGEEFVEVNPDGSLVALQPGEVTLQGTVPGLAAEKGFLFIKALGRVGAVDDNGNINFDILGMVLFFGVSLYLNQVLSGQGGTSTNNDANSQQQTINKITPIIFTGMFLFFPLPAGVLMYMVIANIFQTAQTFILSKEPLPENLQKLVEEKGLSVSPAGTISDNRADLPFEKRSKKKTKPESKKK